MPRVIRMMLHCYADPDTEAQHVYLRDAVDLRRDLHAAQ
jgi:chorismate mutase